MNKIYVKEVRYKNDDGDLLVTVETHKSRPHKYSYLIFV